MDNKPHQPEDRGKVDVIRSRPCENCFLCGSQGVMLYKGLEDRIFGAPGLWNFKVCPSADCKTVWLDPMPIEEDIIIAYRGYYTHGNTTKYKPLTLLRRLSRFLDHCYLFKKYGYGKTEATYWMGFLGVYRSLQPFRSAGLDFHVMHLPVRPGGRLLEVGCGSGENLKVLQDLGWIAEGVDFDAEAVENVRNKGLRVRQGTLEEQNYPNENFDAITMSHLIEHVHDPEHLLRECRRILKKDGRVVIVTPNTRSIGHRIFRKAWRPLEPPRHLHIYCPQAISSLMSKAGFSQIRVFTTIRDANNLFLAGMDLRRFGRHICEGRQSRMMKKIAKFLGLLERIWLVFSPNDGDEMVVIAEK